MRRMFEQTGRARSGQAPLRVQVALQLEYFIHKAALVFREPCTRLYVCISLASDQLRSSATARSREWIAFPLWSTFLANLYFLFIMLILSKILFFNWFAIHSIFHPLFHNKCIYWMLLKNLFKIKYLLNLIMLFMKCYNLKYLYPIAFAWFCINFKIIDRISSAYFVKTFPLRLRSPSAWNQFSVDKLAEPFSTSGSIGLDSRTKKPLWFSRSEEFQGVEV